MTDPQLESLHHQLKNLWAKRDTVRRHYSADEAKRYRELTTQMVRVLIQIEAIEANEEELSQTGEK